MTENIGKKQESINTSELINSKLYPEQADFLENNPEFTKLAELNKNMSEEKTLSFTYILDQTNINSKTKEELKTLMS
jgi:hypothetical protein